MPLFRRRRVPPPPAVVVPPPSDPPVLTKPVTWEGERPWDVERVEDLDDIDLGIFFSDEFAYDEEDAVAALPAWLERQPGIASAVHEDREVIYVWAPGMSVRLLERMVEAFYRDPTLPYSASVPLPQTGMLRLEFVGGSSSKFWEGRVEGTDLVVTFGRIGLAGQERRTACASTSAAQARLQKVAQEKLGKGYVRAT